MLSALSLSAGLAWASGLRLYLTIALVGFGAAIGVVHLPPALAFLASPWMMSLAAVLAIVEFFADKIPALDSLWDAVHTLIRIPAGALLAAAALGHSDPSLQTLAALAGGALAASAHLTKAGSRALINLSPEPLSNWIASSAEDVLMIVGLTLALFLPAVFLVLLISFLCFAGWVLPRLWRGVQGGWRGMATHMLGVEPLRGKHE
ncbi:DUF4126 domain-containing protein [Pararobbsia silviterrae]|uniref:DUF4126 domain-containing protein n=1 Tax=Pararobbsia silviterrae TaxID=1792498 RepID=A0A494YC70_9BURK|nr:DUF4126 domain-containing protein [Pararobbsia silviterrae]RKP57860.1 DUF4126 domain-containing protein [Pararobbsia silviterrae]